MIDHDVLFFFEKKPAALPLYEILERRILNEISGVTVKVQKRRFLLLTGIILSLFLFCLSVRQRSVPRCILSSVLA